MFDRLKLDLSRLYVDTSNDWPLLPRGIVEQLHICQPIQLQQCESTNKDSRITDQDTTKILEEVQTCSEHEQTPQANNKITFRLCFNLQLHKISENDDNNEEQCYIQRNVHIRPSGLLSLFKLKATGTQQYYYNDDCSPINNQKQDNRNRAQTGLKLKSAQSDNKWMYRSMKKKSHLLNSEDSETALIDKQPKHRALYSEINGIWLKFNERRKSKLELIEIEQQYRGICRIVSPRQLNLNQRRDISKLQQLVYVLIAILLCVICGTLKSSI